MPWVVNSWLLHTYASGESNCLFHTIYKMHPVAVRRSSLPFCLCTFQFFHYSCQLMAYAYAHTTLFLYVNQIVMSRPEKVWKSKNYHYYRFGHHYWPHHCQICENRQWCTFAADYELENEKMTGAGLKPAAKDHITIGLWLAPAVFWRPLITAGSSQESTVIELYHCRF